jgi:hypothetical protein
MTISVDLIVLAACLFFFISGFRRGFWRVILGPLSLALGTGAGYFYYQNTRELLYAALIGLFAPFFIKLVLGMVIRLFSKKKDPDETAPVTPGKLAGGAFNLVWGGGIMLLALLCVTLIPAPWAWLDNLRARTEASRAGAFANALARHTVLKGRNDISGVVSLLGDPEKLEGLRHTSEYQEVQEDEKVRAVLSDENLLDSLKKKNLAQILRNQKIQDLFQDKDLVKKFISLQQKLLEQVTGEVSGGQRATGVR